MRKILSVLCLVLAAFFVDAQTATLSGKVTDAGTGETLPGVNIILTGTTMGAISDFDGIYTISGIPAGEYNIQFTYIGYEKTLFTAQKFTEGEQKKLDVKLKTTVLTFDDAVVIYGDKPLVDVEDAKTSTTLTSKEIDLQPVRQIQSVVNKPSWLPILLISIASLSGCATTATPCTPVSPSYPPRPPVVLPMPGSSYLESAKRNMAEWQKQLINVFPTDKP